MQRLFDTHIILCRALRLQSCYSTSMMAGCEQTGNALAVTGISGARLILLRTAVVALFSIRGPLAMTAGILDIHTAVV